MEIRFTHIINHLLALGKKYPQEDQVRKILSVLIDEWQAKVTTIEETKGESMRSVAALFGSLAKHEGKIKHRREISEKTKKSLSLNIKKDEEDDDEMDDEDMSLIVRCFKKFYIRDSNRRFQRNSSSSNNNLKESKQSIICFECKNPGHIKLECPLIQGIPKDKRRDKSGKKKAYVSGIWGNSSSEEESEEETANICLVAQENEESEAEEVMILEPTYDELQSEFNIMHKELIKVARELVTALK